MSVSPYADAVLKSNPSYYWRLGEKTGTIAYDTVGGANGTIVGGVTLGQPGAVADGDGAMRFDGATGTGKILATGPRLSTPCTVEAWVRSSGGTNPPSPILTTPQVSPIVAIGFYASTPQFFVDSVYCRATAPVDDDRFHHQVWVLPGGTSILFYMDGVAYPVAPQLSVPLSLTAVGQIEIGGTAAWGPAMSMTGTIDEVAIYPRALPASEILAHYAARTAAPAQKATTYAQRVIADGAVNYWRLGEQSGTVARDEIGGAHGTISGGVTLGQAGALKDSNAAMRFDGVNGVATIPAGSFYAIGTGPVTVECWVKTSLLQGFKRPCDFKSDGAAVVPGVGILTGGAGQIYLDMMAGGVSGMSVGNVAPYADGSWHHVVGTVTRSASDTGVCYFDGVVIDTRPISMGNGLSLTSTAPAGIGAAAGGPYEPFAGLVDEVALYPYALSPAQVAAHYQLGLGQFGDSPPQPSTAGLPLVDKVLLAGQGALGAGAGVDVAGCASLAFTVVGNGPVTAGAVQLEEAHDPNYAGAWAALGAPVTVPAGAATVKLNQTAKAVRARVSTAIVGGSASVSLVAR